MIRESLRRSAVLLLVAALGCSSPPPKKDGDAKPKPAETKPADSKPAETKPADSKPADSKPADAKASEVTTPSGLKYTDVVVGQGPSPAQGQTAVVHYVGTFTDGKKFDSSRDAGRPFKFHVGKGEVISGWDEGVATMKVGGKRQLVVPPNLGYGPEGYPGAIPPNATLLFEVELLGVE